MNSVIFKIIIFSCVLFKTSLFFSQEKKEDSLIVNIYDFQSPIIDSVFNLFLDSIREIAPCKVPSHLFLNVDRRENYYLIQISISTKIFFNNVQKNNYNAFYKGETLIIFNNLKKHENFFKDTVLINKKTFHRSYFRNDCIEFYCANERFRPTFVLFSNYFDTGKLETGKLLMIGSEYFHLMRASKLKKLRKKYPCIEKHI